LKYHGRNETYVSGFSSGNILLKQKETDEFYTNPTTMASFVDEVHTTGDLQLTKAAINLPLLSSRSNSVSLAYMGNIELFLPWQE
jgi:hypothetical protein